MDCSMCHRKKENGKKSTLFTDLGKEQVKAELEKDEKKFMR